MTSRWTLLLGACCAALLFSFEVNAPQRRRLLDEEGQPIPNAFVAYRYSAGTKLIWPWAHYDGPFLIRSDRDGQFRIPLRIRLRFPFTNILSPARLHIGAYVPRLHNFCALFDPAWADSYCARSADVEKSSIRMRNLEADPARRFRTLWLLLYGGPFLPRTSPAERKEALVAVRREYDEFLSAYGQAVFENSRDKWGYIKIDDWTKESGEFRPWRFFLQETPFYGITMEQKLAQMERQTP